MRDHHSDTGRAKTLAAAYEAVVERGAAYGDPEDSFGRIADFWSVLLRPKLQDGATISPADVALCQIMLKVVRVQSRPEHADSCVDIAGYAACLSEVPG